MGRSYSLDLPERLVGRVAGGQSRRGAADDLQVSPSFSVKLVARHRRTGSFARQGRPPGTGKFAPYRDFLLGRVRQKPHITVPELAAELAARHGVEADPVSLSRFLCKAGFSYKKRCWPRNARALTLPRRATPGSIDASQSCGRCRIVSCSSMRPPRAPN